VPCHIKFPFLLLLAIISIAACPLVTRASPDDPCDPIDVAGASHRLLTGPRGLNYDMVGRAIVNAYNTQHPDQAPLVACPDDGSIASVQLLSEARPPSPLCRATSRTLPGFIILFQSRRRRHRLAHFRHARFQTDSTKFA